jgi:hypothetical protein
LTEPSFLVAVQTVLALSEFISFLGRFTTPDKMPVGQQYDISDHPFSDNDGLCAKNATKIWLKENKFLSAFAIYKKI